MRGAWVVVMTLLIVGTAPPVAAKPLYDEPVYFPERKAYFELVRIPPGYSNRGPGAPAANWQNTRKLAAQRVYRGLRGRLAVVDSPELSAFLRKTFDPRGNAWIGLRYFCQLGRLVWVNGRSHPASGYKNWADPWQEEFACRGAQTTYAPIYVAPPPEGFVWRAQGSSKEQRFYFVEYPQDQP